MTHEEIALLDDLQAWRKAKIAEIYQGHYLTNNQGRSEETLAILRVESGKYERTSGEPEMDAAMQKVREAIAMLEPARDAIVERKLRELRIAGMR